MFHTLRNQKIHGHATDLPVGTFKKEVHGLKCFIGNARKNMNHGQQWKELLTLPEPSAHIVQVYQDPEFLIDAVCRFVCAGLQQSDAIIVVATKEHSDSFSARLELDGFNLQNAVWQGRLRFLDVEPLLAGPIRNDMPDWATFQRQTGEIFDQMPERCSSIRAYDEVSNVLWQGGQYEAAARVEQFWNDLPTPKPLSVFCSYFADHLDSKVYGGQFQHICAHHTHLVSFPDHEKFTKAVGEASEEILGPSMAGMLESLGPGFCPHIDMVPAQAALLYMNEHMPAAALKVMNRVREIVLDR